MYVCMYAAHTFASSKVAIKIVPWSASAIVATWSVTTDLTASVLAIFALIMIWRKVPFMRTTPSR